MDAPRMRACSSSNNGSSNVTKSSSSSSNVTKCSSSNSNVIKCSSSSSSRSSPWTHHAYAPTAAAAAAAVHQKTLL
jgi:hypothetical protein